MDKDTKEWDDWCNVYEYMKELLGYDEAIKLPSYAVLRLRGLADGKFMANKKQKSYGAYPFSTILITMKLSKYKINSYLRRNQSKFKNEQHKFNGIMKIIESEINDVVIRLRKAEKSKIKTEKVDMSHHEHKSAKYTKKKKVNEKLNDLWQEV